MSTANTYEQLVPKLLAMSLPILRANSRMPQLVNTDYSAEARQQGSTVDVPVPPTFGDPVAVAPSATPFQPDAVNLVTRPIALNQWMRQGFTWTDKQEKEVMAGTVPNIAAAAVASLGTYVDKYLLRLYTQAYQFHQAGTFGGAVGNLFGSSVDDGVDAKKALDDAYAPPFERYAVIDTTTESNALKQRAFQDTSWRGDGTGIREGQIGRQFGVDWFVNQNVPTHTAGAAASGTKYKAAGAVSASATQMVVDTGSGDFNVGDVFQVAGASGSYTVTNWNTTSKTVSFSPAAPSGGFADNSDITVAQTHKAGLVFQRDAIALAVRTLDTGGAFAGVMSDTQVDPVTGLVLRLEVTRQNKQTLFEYDILFGAEMIRPELAVRFAGSV